MTRLTRRRHPPGKLQKSYPKGRICESPGCTTRLSIYNDDEICAPCDEALTLADRFSAEGVAMTPFQRKIQRKVDAA